MSSKYDMSIAQIIAAYPMGGPILVSAIAKYIQTMVDRARRDAVDDVAAQHCDQLHDGPPEGLTCKACYDTLGRSRHQAQIEAELEVRRKQQDD